MSKKTLNLKQSRPKLAGSLSELSTPQVAKSGEKEAAREGEREHETETVSAWVASGAGTGAISHEDYELKLRRQAEFPSASVPQMQAEFLNIATTWADDDEMDYDAVPVFSDGIGVTVADSPAKPAVKSADGDSGKKGSSLAVEEASHEQPPASKRASNPNPPAVNPWTRPAPARSVAESVRSTHSNPHSHRSSPAVSPALKSQTIPTTRDHLAEPGSERVSHTESEPRIEKRASQDYRGEETHAFESGRGSRPRSKPPNRGEHYDSQTDRPWMDSRRSHESDTSGPYDRHQHQSHFHQPHEQHPHAPRYPDRRVSIDPTGLNDPYRKSNYPHHPETRNDPSLWRRDDQHPPSRQQSRKSSTSTASPSVSTEKMAEEEPLSWRRRSSVQPSTPPNQPPILSSKSTAGAVQSSGVASLSDEHPQSVESSVKSKPSSSQMHPSQIPNENAWRVKKEEANSSRSKTVPTAILKNQNPTPQPVSTGNNASSAGKSGKDKLHTSYTPAVRPQDASADVSGANKKSRSKSNDRNENAQLQPDANAPAVPLQILKNADPARPSSDSSTSALNSSLKNGTPSSSATRGKAASPSASSTAPNAQHAKTQANAAGLSVSDIDAVMLNIRKIMLEQQEKQSHGDHPDEAAPEQTDGETPETVAVVEEVLEVQTEESSRIESKPNVPVNDAPAPLPSSPKKVSAEVVTESAPKSSVKESLPPPSSPQKPALALQISSPTPALQPLLHAPFSAQPHHQPRQNLPLPVGAFVYPLPPQLWSLPDAPAIIHPLVGVGAHLYQTQQTMGLGAGMQAHHPWNHAHALPIFGTSRFLNV
ncbi:hypothetical protein HDU78_006931 [Chytriomyces hyalinus]|nr:hypothetical protein HDU78_006931 [Chytriomyces hyalinus]